MNDPARQLPLNLPQRQAYGREDFLVTQSNEAAVALIDDWPNWPTYGAMIIGPAGSGKSHLVEVWRQKTGAQIFTASMLTIDLAATLFDNQTLALEIKGPFDERAVFHLLNLARQEHGHILITSPASLQDWSVKIPDLLSRLQALPAVFILPPDDALLRGVIVKHFNDRQINVDEATISYILLRMPRSLAAARALVAQIDQQALAEHAEITRPFVSRIMTQFTSPDFFDQES